jgi:tetratricopeptide (TPR) repeat protein
MSASAERAQALIGRSRWDLAERELEAVLAAEPGNATAQALLALCLVRRGRNRDARRAAREALRLAPDQALPHHVMASVLLELDEGRKAEAAAREAIRLDPVEPAHQALLGQVHLQRRSWAKALEAAERGLALDPRHADAARLRAVALLQLGRRAEADATIGDALTQDPSDATAHASRGWAGLHAGHHRAALDDFREALRLDPTLDLAREGLIRALKARNPAYRLLLRYLLWGSRLGPRAHWMVFTGGLIWVNGLRDWTRYNPGSRVVLLPITLVYLLFVLSVLVGEPLSTAVLATSRYGRLVLSPQERRTSALFAGVVLVAAVPLVAGLVLANDPVFFGGVAVLILVFPVMAAVTAAPGRRRTLLVAAVGASGVVAMTGFVLALTGRGGASYWLFAIVALAGLLAAMATAGTLQGGRMARSG